MKTLPLILIAALGLAACGGEAPEPEPEVIVTERGVAEQTIAAVITQQFPSTSDVAGAANCGVDNATDAEISEFANAGPAGVDTIITQNVLTLLARLETRACIEANGIPPLS